MIAALAGRPVERLEPAVLAALRLGVFQLAFLDRVPAHAAVGESVELAKADSPAAPGSSTRCCAAPPARARARRGAAGGHAGRGRACATRTRVDRRAVVRGARPRRRARADGRRQPPAEAGAARQRAAHRPPPSSPAALPVAEPPGDGPAGGARARGAVRRVRLAAVGARALFMPQSRAAMAVARLLAPRPGERVLDLCAAPGGKTTHLAALMEDRGRVVAVERHRGRAAALARTAQRMGATLRRGAHRRRRRGRRSREAYDRVLVDPPCSDLGTLASRPDARWRKPAGRPRGSRAVQGAILRAGRGRAAPGRHARLLDLHDLAGRERGRRGGVPGRAPRLRGRRPALRRSRSGSIQVSRFPPDAPHRDGTDGFFIARLRRREPREPTRSRPRDVCPACDEPWLRPTNLPGRYRCVNCLHRFELRPCARTAASTRRSCGCPARRCTRATTAGARCWCRSMTELAGVAPSILSADFARLGEQVARCSTRARGDPRRRHGRPLRAADHDGPARGRGARRAGARRGRADRRPPDDRAPRAPDRRRSPTRAPTGSRSTSRRPRTCTTPLGAVREAGCRAGVALNPGTPPEAARRRSPRTSTSCSA